jgi:ABC-type polysaccharide/polyol phosphate transport system ATPase subunit
MNSTSTSDGLVVRDLALDLRVHFHRPTSLRDVFVGLLGATSRTQSSSRTVRVLDGISFEAKKGERIAVIGPNGAGKSSLCRSLAGIYSPTSGKILRFGKIRALFDTLVGVNAELTGRENARLLAQLMYPEETDPIALAEEALAFAELGDYTDAAFKYYSAGMMARLGLSLISARPSEILILDEVFSGADERFREKMNHRMRKLIEGSGLCLLVNHASSILEETCQRALLIHQGKLAFDGDLQGGLKEYRSIQSSFVPSNLMAGERTQ